MDKLELAKKEITKYFTEGKGRFGRTDVTVDFGEYTELNGYGYLEFRVNGKKQLADIWVDTSTGKVDWIY